MPPEVTENNDNVPEQKIQDGQKRIPKKVLYGFFAVAVLGVAVLVGFLLGNRKADAPTDKLPTQTIQKDTAKKPTDITDKKTDALSCGIGKTAFQDKALGAQFCYPTDWGTATINDAKVAAADTGHREVVRFSSNPYVIVGGMSDDWSTSVGRGVGCLEPDNVVPPLSAYDTSWHGIEGSGADVSYAVRSLPSSAGGYSVQESVSNLLVSGVCVQGHKVISGSRYRVVAVNYARDFAPASGITTPAQHMAEPNVLFSTELRTQYDALLASLAAY